MRKSGFPPAAWAIRSRSSDGSGRDQLVDRRRGQRLEAQRDRPVGALREELGRAMQTTRIGAAEESSADALDEVEEGLLAPLDVVEDDDERRLLLEQLAERPARSPRRTCPCSVSPSSDPIAAAATGSDGRASSCLITSTTGQ